MKKVKIILLAMCLVFFADVVNIRGQENDDMENIEQIYRIGFSKYLLEKLDLKAFDDELQKSEMKIIPCDEEHKTEAQKKDELGLEYIFVRNDVHIDRLSAEQQELLASQNLKDSYSDEVMQLIEKTFVDVMGYKKIESEEDKKVKTFYDQKIYPQFVTYDTIVIKIATMHEYDENGNYVDREHENEKESFLSDYASDMEKTLEGKLGDIPISVQVQI